MMNKKKEARIAKRKEKPAITIHIQSWMTPILGIVMLLIGLFGGYYGRSLGNNSQEVIEVDQPPNAPPQTGAGNEGDEDAMAYLVSQTRHFRGDPDAPVTLVEFGDFQ
jgi:hypothetical protein